MQNNEIYVHMLTQFTTLNNWTILIIMLLIRFAMILKSCAIVQINSYK